MRLLAAMLLGSTVVGCALDAPVSPIRDPHPSIDGTAWRLVAIGAQPMPDRPPLTIEFVGERLRGEGPCNQISGSVRYDRASGSIQVGDVITTKRACLDPALARLEATFVGAVGGSTAVGLDESGGLVLSGSGLDLRFVEIARAIPAAATAPPR